MYRLSIILFFLTLTLPSFGQQNSTTDIELTDGKSLYKKHCSSCHGRKGGLGLAGAANLKTSTLDQPEVVSIITNGGETMIPFHGQLQEEQIDILAKYVATLRKSK